MGSRDTMHRARRWLPGVHVDNLPRQKHHWLVVGLIAGVLLISCGTRAATSDSRPTDAALSVAATPTRAPGLAPTVVPTQTPPLAPAAPTGTPTPGVPTGTPELVVPTGTPLSSPTIAPPTIWQPPLQTSWQWQLSNLPVDQSVDALVYDIDLFDNDATVVASLHARGRKVICYLSAGTWEKWRPDAHLFPPAVRGTTMDDWPDEQWLDIRQLDVLAPIMEARLDLCQRKGFDGVEPDNIDGWVNETGFPLTAADQLAYNRWLADAAHARGLSIGLKNDLRQVEDLVDTFDWALNEECFQLNECAKLIPFIEAGKAVFHVEYALAPRDFCAEAAALGFNSMRKDVELSAYREACPATAAPD